MFVYEVLSFVQTLKQLHHICCTSPSSILCYFPLLNIRAGLVDASLNFLKYSHVCANLLLLTVELVKARNMAQAVYDESIACWHRISHTRNTWFGVKHSVLHSNTLLSVSCLAILYAPWFRFYSLFIHAIGFLSPGYAKANELMHPQANAATFQQLNNMQSAAHVAWQIWISKVSPLHFPLLNFLGFPAKHGKVRG